MSGLYKMNIHIVCFKITECYIPPYRQFHIFQKKNISVKKLSSLKEYYLQWDTIKDFRLNQNKQKESIGQKFSRKSSEINEWYIKKIGLDQVKLLQDRIVVMQEELSKAQNLRRELDTQLKEKRVNLNRIQEQINKINRYKDSSSGLQYIELIQEETKEIIEEKELFLKFDVADKKERELFTSFCIAIRDSHDKERAQAEYTKYFGIILSIIGTIVGSILTLIINSVRTKDLLSGIEQVVDNQIHIKDEKLDRLDGDVRNLVLSVRGLAETINRNKRDSSDSSNKKTEEVEQPSRWYLGDYSKTQVVSGVVAVTFGILKLFGF